MPAEVAGSADTTPAVVVVAHDQPVHFRRLMAAIQPLRSFVHIDANTSPEIYSEMVTGLPDTVTLLPRLKAGWARYEVLEAELSGYRAALETTDAEHLILLTGADYPLASTDVLTEYLARNIGRSFVEIHRVPRPNWGPTGGADRFWFRQWPWGRHRMLLPIPRRRPAGVVRAAGSQSKVLCRTDAHYVVNLLDRRPDLWKFFRRCWAPDEVTIHSLLSSNELGSTWHGTRTEPLVLWYVDWSQAPVANPRTLSAVDFPTLQIARSRADGPALFARKFRDDSGEVLDQIDGELRTAPIHPAW